MTWTHYLCPTAERQGYKRHSFPQATVANKEEIQGPGAMRFLSLLYVSNFKFVSDIETYTLWKLIYKKVYPRHIEFFQATAESMLPIQTPPPAKVCLTLSP